MRSSNAVVFAFTAVISPFQILLAPILLRMGVRAALTWLFPRAGGSSGRESEAG